MKDGQIELMLHRRLLVDDNLGVEEPLNEGGVIGNGIISRGKHRIFLTTKEEGNYLHRINGENMMAEPIIR